MVNAKSFILGFLVCLILCSCAGAVKYYGLDGVRYEEGKLTGPSPKHDRAFSDCQPNGEYPKGACVVMFFSEFNSYKRDCTDCQMRLNECERYKNAQP